MPHSTLTGDELHVPGYKQSGDPGAVGAGIWWEDTTTNPPVFNVRDEANTGWVRLLRSPLVTADLPSGVVQRVFAQTADKTLANDNTETSLFGTGVGSTTLTAAALTVGRSVRVKLCGYQRTTGGTMRDRFKLGGVTVFDTTLYTQNVSLAVDVYWEFEGLITCRTTGVTGTVMVQGRMLYESNTVDNTDFGLVGSIPNTTTATVDTTGTLAIDFTRQYSGADPDQAITVTNATIELL